MRKLHEIPENAAAVPCGRYKGRRYYRIPVTVLCNDSRQLRTVSSHRFNVIAASAADAANWAADRVRWRAETEIYATGPKGGTVKRYIGWHSAIGSALLDREPRAVQFDMFSEGN